MTATAATSIRRSEPNSHGIVHETVTSSGTYIGRGEFYSGLHAGSRVVIEQVTAIWPDGSTPLGTSTMVRGKGAWLSVHNIADIVFD